MDNKLRQISNKNRTSLNDVRKRVLENRKNNAYKIPCNETLERNAEIIHQELSDVYPYIYQTIE